MRMLISTSVMASTNCNKMTLVTIKLQFFFFSIIENSYHTQRYRGYGDFERITRYFDIVKIGLDIRRDVSFIHRVRS